MIKLNKQQRWRFLIAAIIIGGLSGILSKTYRCYIYAQHINDFHIADSFPDFFAVPAALCAGFALTGKKDKPMIVYILAVCGCYIIYEFLFSLTYDIYDIFAAVISGVICYGLFKYIFSCISGRH